MKLKKAVSLIERKKIQEGHSYVSSYHKRKLPTATVSTPPTLDSEDRGIKRFL